jgi:uncharacterized protein
MKRTVDVFELARDAGRVEGQLEAAELPRLSDLLAPPMGSIHFDFEGRIDDKGRSAADLRLEGSLGLKCDRCGTRLEWPLDESSGFFFVDDERELTALPITAEGDEPLLGSRQFDLQDLVEEQTILALPISPRHPSCETAAPGAEEPEQAASRPFAALAALKRGRTDIQ